MIKQLILFIVLLFSAALVQAQNVTKKPVGNSSPQLSLPLAQVPEMSNALKPVTNTEGVTETPSPLTKDKNQQIQEKEKPVMKLADDKKAVTPGGEEGRRIMAGKATRPALEINNQSTIETKPASPPVKPTKPAIGQQL